MMLLLLALPFLSACTSINTRGEQLKADDLAGHYYLVRSGDTWAALADRFHVSIAEIMDVNGIDDETKLHAGLNLYLPEPDPIRQKLLRPKSHKTIAQKDPVFEVPVKGKIVRKFSTDKEKPYDGIAIKAPVGTKVRAALTGRVIFVGDDGNKYGLLVIIEHKDPFVTVYTQLDKALVSINQHIKQGEIIGTVGRSGGATVSHLHFQIRVDQRPQDPRKFLRL